MKDKPLAEYFAIV